MEPVVIESVIGAGLSALSIIGGWLAISAKHRRRREREEREDRNRERDACEKRYAQLHGEIVAVRAQQTGELVELVRITSAGLTRAVSAQEQGNREQRDTNRYLDRVCRHLQGLPPRHPSGEHHSIDDTPLEQPAHPPIDPPPRKH